MRRRRKHGCIAKLKIQSSIDPTKNGMLGDLRDDLAATVRLDDAVHFARQGSDLIGLIMISTRLSIGKLFITYQISYFRGCHGADASDFAAPRSDEVLPNMSARNSIDTLADQQAVVD